MTEADVIESQHSKAIEEWFAIFIILGFFTAICLVGYQGFLWLKHGQWTPIPISSILDKLNVDYFSLVNISWTGAQKIIIWLLDLPLSRGIVVFCGIIGSLAENLMREFSMHKNDS